MHYFCRPANYHKGRRARRSLRLAAIGRWPPERAAHDSTPTPPNRAGSSCANCSAHVISAISTPAAFASGRSAGWDRSHHEVVMQQMREPQQIEQLGIDLTQPGQPSQLPCQSFLV